MHSKTFHISKVTFALIFYFIYFISYAAPSTGGPSAAVQFQYKNWVRQNNLNTSAIDGKSVGWTRVSEPEDPEGYFYAPLSITTLKGSRVSVQSLINYTSDEGNPESLLGVTLYNCASRTKQEQSTVQYSKQWADGEVILQIGLEEPWVPVKVGSAGMRLLKIVCDLS